MTTNRKYFAKTRTLPLKAWAVATGTFLVFHPAIAQQDDADHAPRERVGRETGPVQPPAEFDDQAKAILAKSAERYKNLQSWHVEQKIVNAGRFSRDVTADFRSPQDLVVTDHEAKGIKTVAYYNAKNISTSREFDGLLEYQVQPLNVEVPTAGSNLRLAFGSALGQYLSGFFIGEESVFGRQRVLTVKYAGDATVDGIPVENVTVASVVHGQPAAITYSIGKEDSLLHEVVQTIQNADGTSSDYVETYSNQKVDAQLPDSLFTFNVPAGAKKVERFTQYRGIQVKTGGEPAALKLKDIDGKALSLDQYKGKVVLLDFWATWCPPCRAELPKVKAAYTKYKDQGFDVLGVSLDISKDPLTKFIAKESLGWRQVYDGYWNGPVASAYNVRFIPSTILIGRDGKVAAVGVRGENLDSAIQSALAGP